MNIHTNFQLQIIILKRLLETPATADQLATLAGVSRKMIIRSIADMRKSGYVVYTIGFRKDFSYEYHPEEASWLRDAQLPVQK